MAMIALVAGVVRNAGLARIVMVVRNAPIVPIVPIVLIAMVVMSARIVRIVGIARIARVVLVAGVVQIARVLRVAGVLWGFTNKGIMMFRRFFNWLRAVSGPPVEVVICKSCGSPFIPLPKRGRCPVCERTYVL